MRNHFFFLENRFARDYPIKIFFDTIRYCIFYFLYYSIKQKYYG